MQAFSPRSSNSANVAEYCLVSKPLRLADTDQTIDFYLTSLAVLCSSELVILKKILLPC